MFYPIVKELKIKGNPTAKIDTTLTLKSILAQYNYFGVVKHQKVCASFWYSNTDSRSQQLNKLINLVLKNITQYKKIKHSLCQRGFIYSLNLLAFAIL